MNEVVPTDPPAEARPDQRPTDARPGRWGPRLRWFAAEFTVVVAGILVALAIHAWWQGQQDRAKERMYLLQIAADLQETERIVMEADSVSRSRERAGNLFLRAYFTPQRPPLDSLLVWRRQANWYSNPIPVVATIEALVATGDLALVRDDGLRLAITTYLAASRQQMTQSQSYADMWTRGADQVDSRLDFAEALVAFHDSAQLDSLSH